MRVIAPDTTSPPTPTGLTATGHDRAATLTWDPINDPNTNDLDGYLVYQSTESNTGPWTKLTPNPIQDTTYTATNLTNGQKYWYAIAAADTTGNTSPKTTTHTTPTAPDTTSPPTPAHAAHCQAGGKT